MMSHSTFFISSYLNAFVNTSFDLDYNYINDVKENMKAYFAPYSSDFKYLFIIFCDFK